jgi:hypothetical protein
MAASPSAFNSDRLHVGSGSSSDIFYQNVSGLRTKSVEIFSSVCSSDFKIICLTKILLNGSFSSHTLFPPKHILYIILIETVMINYVVEVLLIAVCFWC